MNEKMPSLDTEKQYINARQYYWDSVDKTVDCFVDNVINMRLNYNEIFQLEMQFSKKNVNTILFVYQWKKFINKLEKTTIYVEKMTETFNKEKDFCKLDADLAKVRKQESTFGGLSYLNDYAYTSLNNVAFMKYLNYLIRTGVDIENKYFQTIKRCAKRNLESYNAIMNTIGQMESNQKKNLQNNIEDVMLENN